jgi:orotidine-5'-phosphate decarboxylase
MLGTEAAPPRIDRLSLSASERLIVALDTATVDEAMALVDRLGDIVSFYKIGLHLQLSAKLHLLVSHLTSRNKKIFLDFKYIDIPATVAGAVRTASQLGIDFITVIGQQPIVAAAIEARGDTGLKILAVTLLTGMSEEDLQREYHTSLTLPEFVKRRALDAERVKCDGVISSPNEIELIRSTVRTENFLIVTPGIRPVGAARNDQKRTATPYDAISRGADYLVVGRPIIADSEPREAAQCIIDEMALAFDRRGDKTRSPTSGA